MLKSYVGFRTRKIGIFPTGWKLVELKHLIIDGPTNGIHKSAEYIGFGNCLLLDINGLYSSLKADFSHCRRVQLTPSEKKHYILTDGDILFNRVSVKPEGVGKAVLVENVPQNTAFESNMMRVRIDKNYLLPEFFVDFLSCSIARKQILSQAKITAQTSISQETLTSLLAIVPPIAEQRKIAEILGTWDEAIEKTERLITALEQRKKGLMQRLLTGQVRFSGFVNSGAIQVTKYGQIPSDWKYVPIKKIAHQVSEKNSDSNNFPVLSCTKHFGLVDSLEYFGRQMYSKDTSTYKIVGQNQFAYATNHIEEGSIGYQSLYKKALISPMYTVFETNKLVNDSYLYKLLKTELFRHIFEVNTSASVNRRGSLRWSEFSLLKIPLPSLEEQKAIANILEKQEEQILKMKIYLDKLRTQKKGLMQRLLTGQVRVQPAQSQPL